MKKQTKAMSLALSAALAASSFAALAVTASAAGDISLDGEKTFDAVRITYTAATEADAALTVGGDSYTVPAGTTSTVVNVAEDTTASTIGLSNYNPNTTEIKLLDYSRITLNKTADAPYLAKAYNGGDSAATTDMGNIVTASGRFANAFDGNYTNNSGLFRPLTTDNSKRADNGWYVLNFDLGAETEIAKIKIYTSTSDRVISGYTIGAISDVTATSADSEAAKVSAGTLRASLKTDDGKRYINTLVNTTADKLQVKFDDYYIPASELEKEDAIKDNGDYTWGGNYAQINELELYTYADVYTVEKQTITYTSDAVNLGKAVTFNKLTADENANWETSTDGETWTAYTDGADTTAQYIRTTSEESTPSVPAFTLSWEGNLAKYAGEGYNGASITGANHSGGPLSVLYNGAKDYDDNNSKDESVLIYPSYSVHNIQFNLNAPAAIESVQAYWVSSGVMYPHTYKIETSNKGTVWNTTNLTIDEKYEANKKAYTDGVHYLNVTAAIVNIDYTESYRIVDSRSGDIVRTTEIEIPGTVPVASYDGANVSFPVIPNDEQPVVEPTKVDTEKSAIFNSENDAAAISFATDDVELDENKSVSDLKWVVTNSEGATADVDTAADSTTFTGGSIKLALIITGTAEQLNTLESAVLVIE